MLLEYLGPAIQYPPQDEVASAAAWKPEPEPRGPKPEVEPSAVGRAVRAVAEFEAPADAAGLAALEAPAATKLMAELDLGDMVDVGSAVGEWLGGTNRRTAAAGWFPIHYVVNAETGAAVEAAAVVAAPPPLPPLPLFLEVADPDPGQKTLEPQPAAVTPRRRARYVHTIHMGEL